MRTLPLTMNNICRMGFPSSIICQCQHKKAVTNNMLTQTLKLLMVRKVSVPQREYILNSNDLLGTLVGVHVSIKHPLS